MDKIRNQTIRNRLKVKRKNGLLKKFEPQQLRWFAHRVRMEIIF